MINKLLILSILFHLIFINCNTRKNLSYSPFNKSNQKETKIIQNLEILNTPQNTGYPDENDKNWEPVAIPFINKLSKPYFKDKCSFWIRGKFNIEEIEKFRYFDYYAVNLGVFAADVTVFINRLQINNLQANLNHNWLKSKSYIIPSYINLKERNDVYLHFIVRGEKYITFLSDFTVQNQIEYNRSQNWYTFLYTQIPVGFSILITGLLILLLRNYFQYNIKRYLLYALNLLSISFCILLIYFPINLLDQKIIMIIYNSFLPVNILFTILIIQAICKIYLRRENIILSCIFIIIPICMFITELFSLNNNYEIIFNIILLIFSITYFIYLLYYLNLQSPDRFKFNIIISYSVLFFIFYIIEIIGVLFNSWYQYSYYIISIPIYAVPIIIFEVREAGKRKKALRQIYKKLDNNQLLTESAENKINRIIVFIDNNFISDISREGLASAVDMNYNYMSRLFLKHTGKKINEYINHLRIKEATRMLREPDLKIKVIDVALNVGFENLSTFNRVFKDITGQTPTAFKKKYN